MNKHSYIYILGSKKNGTLYIGVTSNLEKRIEQHKQVIYKGFTQKYTVSKLLYYEQYFDIHTAIAREKNIKKWKRQWKINLIERFNPYWDDIEPGFLPAQE